MLSLLQSTCDSNNIQFIKDTRYCKILIQANKVPYTGAGSEIDFRGNKNFNWQTNQIHNTVYIPKLTV